LAETTARPLLTGPVRFAPTVAGCAAAADVLVVCNPDPAFKTLKPAHLVRHPTVIDCWRLLDRAALSPVCRYIALGTADVAVPVVEREVRRAS
jgi:hypothetical protein